MKISFENQLKSKVDAKVVLLPKAKELKFAPLKDFLSKDEFANLAANDETYCQKTKLVIVRYQEKASNLDIQKLGGKLIKTLWKQKSCAIFAPKELACDFALGMQLGSYAFNKYKTKQKPEQVLALQKTTFIGSAKKADYKDFSAVLEGVYMARDLSSEPANVLTPKEFVKRIKELEDTGLKVSVLDKKELTKKGFGLLLSVAQGSCNEPYVAVVEWVGNPSKKDYDLCLVGKGVCFDSGGISIKPSNGMEDMKQDMAGAAAVVATMKTIALQKSDKNILCAVGLVENMPSGTAARPGDVVTSLSKQTVEVINTDAEGRLVLSDVLTYVQDKYKVNKIIDVATLTGAISVALANLYAGAIGNSQKMIDGLIASGQKTGEKLWQLPIDKDFDKMINSDIADMKNIGSGRGGGSITAACFLQRFIKEKTSWVHLDIAGVDMQKSATPTCPKGARGFGVMVLTHYINNLK